MLRKALLKLILMPLGVVLAGFLAFAYAFYIGPIQASRNPYAFGEITVSNFWVKVVVFFSDMVRFDFGLMPNKEAIITVVMRSCLASIGLLLISIVISSLIGVFLGITTVKMDPPKTSRWLFILSTFAQASPGFYIGVLFISLSIIYVIWGNGTQPFLPFQGFGWDAHLILPVLTLSLQPTIKIAQITSGFMVEEMGKQYVVVTRSFGHSLKSIRWKFVFRNISVGVVLTIASAIRFMVAELIIIERLFNWPGIGKLISSVLVITSNSDNFLHPPLFAVIMMILVVIFLLSDLIAWTLTHALDPRLRNNI